jgi:hypothetical protein
MAGTGTGVGVGVEGVSQSGVDVEGCPDRHTEQFGNGAWASISALRASGLVFQSTRSNDGVYRRIALVLSQAHGDGWCPRKLRWGLPAVIHMNHDPTPQMVRRQETVHAPQQHITDSDIRLRAKYTATLANAKCNFTSPAISAE